MEFGVLGPLEVSDSGHEVPLRRGLPRSLLTLLLLRREVAVPADVIAERLWGDDPPADPRNAVQQLVGHVRRALGPEGGALLLTRGSSYLLAVADESVDARRFERHVHQANQWILAGTAAGARSALVACEEALELWRADPLADISQYEWAQPEIARLQEMALRAREMRVTALLTLGQHDQALVESRSLADAYPLREQVHAELALALYRSGRQSEALAALASVRRQLASELGLDPGPQLQLLERRILTQDETLAWVPPADLDGVNGRRATQPLSGSRSGRRLGPPTSLIGRAEHLDTLESLLDQTPLLTLTGAGGAGKTRLAAELARRQTHRPVWFVDLSVLADQELVATTTARVVGAVHAPEQSPEDAIVDKLRDVRGLLILDNCEHVIEAASRLASALQQGCPELVLVTTSRRPLRVSGEVTWSVPPLSTPEAEALSVEEIRDIASVQLFVERSAAARPDFTLTEHNAADIAAIVRSLDGLPLAIELAAGHADVLTAPAIRQRLLDRFDLLQTDARDAPSRQRTLRAVIESSVSLLTDEERRFFVRLGVFAGSFTLDAATAVCSGGVDSYRMVASLVRQSLVAPTHTGRYRLLESVRAYASQALAEDPGVVDVRSHHCEYLIELMTRADHGIRADGQDYWLAQIEESLPDLRSALEWSLGGAAQTRGAALAASSNWFWTLEGMLAEADRWLSLALTASPIEDAVRASLLLATGRIAAPRGDLAHALTSCAESAEISRRIGDDRAHADALVTLGVAQWAIGDLVGAASSHDEAARLAAASGDDFVRDAALVLRARTAVDANQPDADLLIDEAITRARRSREKHRIGLAVSQKARRALLLGDGQTAYDAAQECLAAWGPLGYKEGEVNALNLLARASTALGRPLEAEGFAIKALRVARAIGHRGALCQGLESLAEALHATGRDDRAGLLLAISAAERDRANIPAPAAEANHLADLSDAVRGRLGDSAAQVARSAAYRTVDDLLDLIGAEPA